MAEKIKKLNDRMAIHLVKPRKGTLKYFDCFYLIPTILTYSMNTYQNGKKYIFTRYTGFHFLWWSVEVSMEYGKV